MPVNLCAACTTNLIEKTRNPCQGIPCRNAIKADKASREREDVELVIDEFTVRFDGQWFTARDVAEQLIGSEHTVFFGHANNLRGITKRCYAALWHRCAGPKATLSRHYNHDLKVYIFKPL